MFPFWKDWQLQFLFPLDSQVWWSCEKERRSRLRRWELYTEKIRNHIGLGGFFLFLQFLKHFLFILPPFRLFWCVLHHMPQCLVEHQVTSFGLKPQQFLGFLALNPTIKGIQHVFFGLSRHLDEATGSELVKLVKLAAPKTWDATRNYRLFRKEVWPFRTDSNNHGSVDEYPKPSLLPTNHSCQQS